MEVNEPMFSLTQNHVSLAERIADELSMLIYAGDLVPGAVLSEAGIARQLGVSRSPVREAIALLASDGLVQSPPRKSAFVTEYSVDDCSALYDSRMLVDSYLSGEAAGLASDEDIARLSEKLEAMVVAAESQPKEYRATMEKLTFDIYELGSNPVAADFARTLWYRSLPYRSLVPLAARLSDSLEMHAALVEAIGRRNKEGAKQVTEAGLRQYKEAIIARLSREGSGQSAHERTTTA